MNVTLLLRSTLIMFYLTKFLSREIGVLQFSAIKINPKQHKDAVLDQSLSKTRNKTINGGSSRYPRALTKQAIKTNLHTVYPFIQTGRRSTERPLGLASHQT